MNYRFSIGDRKPSQLTDKHANIRANSARLVEYCAVGVSVRGRLHIQNKVPRDDAFAIRSNSMWLAAAVSDGAGSRPLSRYGASYAVNSLCTRLFYAAAKLKQDGTEAIVHDAFQITRRDLERFACKQKTPLEDLHCTLLGLILNVETGVVGTGHIGDGLILGFTNDKTAIPLAESPIPDELGATYFLTQDNWERYFRLHVLSSEKAQRFNTFYLMTDGVADDCQYGPPPDILQHWAKDMDREIRTLPSPEKTAKRLKRYLATYRVKGSFDDRTLVVIYRERNDRII